MTAPLYSIEAALVSWCNERKLSAPASAETWKDFSPPLIVIERVGGGHDGYRVHDAVIDIDAFADNRLGAESLAWEADSALHDIVGITHRGLVVTRVNVTGAPRSQNYGNENIRRFTATYRLTYHAA